MKKGLLLLAGLLMLTLPTTALAADYAKFQQDSVDAYNFYKKALSLTSKSNTQEKSIATVNMFLSSWRKVSTKYKQNVPEPFIALPNYSELIDQPLAIGEQALIELKAGQIAAAHSTLEDIRYLLWKMRTDAGLVTLTDKVNDFHEVMEVILDKMKEDETAENFRKVGKRYGPWVAIKWEEQAGVDVFPAERSAFGKSMEEGRKAIAELRDRLSAGDVKAAKAAGKKMKKAYKGIFFLNSTT